MLLTDFPVGAALAQRPAVFLSLTGQEEVNRSIGVAASSVLWSGAIEFGEARYPLLHPLYGGLNLTPDGFVLTMQRLSPLWVGEGTTPVEAEHNLRYEIHLAFQHLHRKRPGQMTAEETSRWRALEAAIDVSQYSRETPLVVREIGTVLWLRQYRRGVGREGLKIRWFGGEAEIVRYEDAPPAFAALRPGHWFRATTKRDAVSRQLIAVVDVERLPGDPSLTNDQVEAYWNGLGTTASLPEGAALGE